MPRFDTCQTVSEIVGKYFYSTPNEEMLIIFFSRMNGGNQLSQNIRQSITQNLFVAKP